MLKGDISRQPALICCVDYRILIKGKYRLKLRDGARDWILRNWETYFAVFSVGKRFDRRAEKLVEEFIPEYYRFSTPEKFRHWISLNVERLFRVYTNDPALLGLDELIQRHTDWIESL